MENENLEYAKFINNCLSELGITRSEAGRTFAKIAGISEEAGKDLIYRYCQGTRRPGRGNAIYLAEMLGCSVDEVLNGKKSVAITPTLRTTFKQRGYTLQRYIEKLNHVVPLSLPLFNKDEFGFDALDYCIQNSNNDGIKYLIENKICEFDNLYTELTHSCKEKGNIKLSELFPIARANNDEELLQIIYPKENKYCVVDKEEDPELYVTKLLKDTIKYFYIPEEGLNMLSALKKHFLTPFNLDEKIFVSRNNALIKNKSLMKLSSFNAHTNILAKYCEKKMLKKFLEVANEHNALTLDAIYRAGVKADDLILKENGYLFYVENKKEYWITTLAVLPPSRIDDSIDVCPEAFAEYTTIINLPGYMNQIKEYYDNYDNLTNESTRLCWLPIDLKIAKDIAKHLCLKRHGSIFPYIIKENKEKYYFRFDDKYDENRKLNILIDKFSKKVEVFLTPTQEQLNEIIAMNDVKGGKVNE